MNTNVVLMTVFVFFGGAIVACQPKTAAEKVKDNVEDAVHETGQAIERAGEKVKDAAN